MKNIFSRKHDTQTGNSKYKFWISGSTQERSAPRPVPIQSDNTRIQTDIRTSGRAASVTNLQPRTAEDKTYSVSTPGPLVEKTIYPTSRTYTVPQATVRPSRPSSSKHRDDAKYEPPRAGYASTSTHEREDRAKGFRLPSGSELTPKNRTDLYPPPQSSKQPGPLDDRHREQPFPEDTRRYRNEDNDARHGIRMESSNVKEPREGVEDRLRLFREQITQRRDKDRARESEPEGMREREKDKVRQRERERHQREYEKERERLKGDRQQREYGKQQERVRQQEMENERERERQNELEKERELERAKALEKGKEKERQRERQKESEQERQRDEKERHRQEEEWERERQRRQWEKQREMEKETERQKELERERLKEEKERREMERERRMELERERERERQKERERHRAFEKEREKERDRQKELERLKEEQKEKEMERERRMELEKERERERRERERQRVLEKEREREQERLKEEMGWERQMELERERQKEERERERERESEREREKELEREREKQRELEKERERHKELERERLKEERERERQLQKEREMERARRMELERERQKEEREREREGEQEKEREELEREREKQRELEKERERHKELERERLKEERERERQLQKEREMERARRMELERERQKEVREREREKEKELEREREREKQRELEKERERLKEERERERQLQKEREMERERRMELEREQQKEVREREKEKELEREREWERQRELEKERERLKEERERERQLQREREMERERRMQLERERQKDEREREKELEREREKQRELEKERERLKEERERERQLQKEREMERERRMQLERERQKDEKEREKELERELEREMQRELEKERERQKELEREREKEREALEREKQREFEKERDRLEELERERHREFERQREKQKELERERLREEKERERQKQREKERERERQKELEREFERDRQMELERERQQERQKEEAEKETERERQREHEKHQRLKNLEREMLEQQREMEMERRGKDRGRREMARNRARERERQDQEHDRERLHHEGREGGKQQELVNLAKPSIVDLKPKHLDDGADPSQRESDMAEGVIRVSPKNVEARPAGDGEYRKEKAVKDPRQEHYRAEPMDRNKDRLRTKAGWDRERYKEGKLGRLSDNQPSRGLRTFRQPHHEHPVADGWGDSSDDSVDQVLFPQSGSKRDRTDDEKARQNNSAGGWNIQTPGNEFRLNQAPINLIPHYATPRVTPIPLTSLTGRHAIPLASNLVNIGTAYDNEPVRREINRSKLNRDDAEPLKPTESSRPPSRVSFLQGINPMPPQTQNHLAQLKDVQPSSHTKSRSEDLWAQNVPIELPVNAVLNSGSTIAQEAGCSRFPSGNGKGLKTFPDPSMESKEAQAPSMRLTDYQGKRVTATPAPITSTLPTGVQLQSDEKVARTTPPQVQNSTPPSVSVDVERHQNPLVGSNTRPLTTTDAPRVSSVTLMPNLGISVPIPDPPNASSITSGVDSRIQALSPPNILHSVDSRNVTNNSTTVFATTVTQNPAPQIRPSSHPATRALASPHNRESASLPVPSSETCTPFSALSVNASQHVDVSQSGTRIPASVETPPLAKPPMPNWGRNVATRLEIRQGPKADSPFLPKKGESLTDKHQFVQTVLEGYPERVMEQLPPARGEVDKVDSSFLLDAPGDHSIPSVAAAQVVHRRFQYHPIEPSKLDDLNNPSRVVGTSTRPGTEVPVFEKTTEKPPINGKVDVLTGVASLAASITHGAPVKCLERPFSNPVVDAQNQRGPAEPTISYVGHDISGQQTPDIPLQDVGKPAALGNSFANNYHHKSQPMDQNIIASLQSEGSSDRPPTGVMASNMRLSMISGLKTDHSGGPSHTPPFTIQINRQPAESVSLQVKNPVETPARPFDRSPRRSLPQTVEMRMSNSKDSPDLNTATQPKEVVPLAKEASNKVYALSFPRVTMTTHSPLPINVEAPSNYDQNAQTYTMSSPEMIPPHSEIREPQSANLVLAPPISHVPVPAALESNSTQVEIVPQIKIRYPDDTKQGIEIPLGSRPPIFSGAPEPAAVTLTPTLTSQTSEVRKKESFGKGLAGVSDAKFRQRNQHYEIAETKVLKVDDIPVSSFVASTKVRSHDFDGQAKKRSNKESPRIKKAEPTLTRVLLRDADESRRRKPSSKKESPKVMAIIGDEGDSKEGAVHVTSSRQDNTEQLRSSKLSMQQLPVITDQTNYNSDVPQTKIQHPVLAELLSSPQTVPMMQLSPAYPREVHLGNQSKLNGTPPERHRQELEPKIQPTKDALSRSSHKKHSSTTFRTAELPPLREHHQLQTTVDVVTRAKLARTSDQVSHDQRKNAETSKSNQPSQVSRQEHNSNYRIPEIQRGITMASQPVQQPTHGRQQHSASVPTSSARLENAVPELPGYDSKQAFAQGRPVMGDTPSDKQVLSVPPSASQETIPMTPASFAHSPALKETDPRPSNAESVNSQTGKKIRRFRLPSTQTTSAQPHQVWHPGTPSKTPNSSPSQSSGTPLEPNLNPNGPNKKHSVPFPKGKDAEAAVASSKYLIHRKRRSVSGASMEARNGTAPSTIVGSPNASMHSATPLPPPPTRDAWTATHDWVSKAEDRVQSRPRRKRPRPGVVFDTDEDAPEDKQRPRRTLTKHRSSAKRHESPTS